MTRSRHATAVAAGGHGLLITGPSGSGKSTLALEMMALGAALICDDQVMLTRRGNRIIASAPNGAPALIEARGIGLIPVAELAQPTPLSLIIDLGIEEGDRLPPARVASLLGVGIRSLRKPAHLVPAALFLALQAGGPLNADSHAVRIEGHIKRN